MSIQQKIGIFGGTFSPIHYGHINSMLSVFDLLGLQEIRVVPAFQSPHRDPIEGPNPQQRAEMVELAVRKYAPQLVVDTSEVRRGGTSYTIDTLEELQVELGTGAEPESSKPSGNEPSELYLIVGADQIGHFDQWKDFEKILNVANLVVTSRPGGELPKTTSELPEGLQPLVEEFTKEHVLLKSGKSIYWIYLEDIDISSTEIRRKARNNEKIENWVPSEVVEYINDNKIYAPVEEKIEDFLEFTKFCGEYLNSRKAIQVRAWDLVGLSKPTDYALIASGTSRRHTTAMAENLVREVKTKFHIYPQSVNGKIEGSWILLDYGLLMIHIFYDYRRMEVNLEDLMREGKEFLIENHSAEEKGQSEY